MSMHTRWKNQNSISIHLNTYIALFNSGPFAFQSKGNVTFLAMTFDTSSAFGSKFGYNQLVPHEIAFWKWKINIFDQHEGWFCIKIKYVILVIKVRAWFSFTFCAELNWIESIYFATEKIYDSVIKKKWKLWSCYIKHVKTWSIINIARPM